MCVLFTLQLVLTVGLLAVVVYLYTVVAFNFFRKFYNKGEDGEVPDMKCDDMLTVSTGNMQCSQTDHSLVEIQMIESIIAANCVNCERWCHFTLGQQPNMIYMRQRRLPQSCSGSLLFRLNVSVKPL